LNFLCVNDLPGLSIYVHKPGRNSVHVEPEHVSAGNRAFLTISNLNDDDSTVWAVTALNIFIINPERAMMPSGYVRIDIVHFSHVSGWRASQMLEGVQYPIADHRNSVMLLEQMKPRTCVGNHPLHDVIRGHQIPEVVFVVPDKCNPTKS